VRCLDIGPGSYPAAGFETLDAIPGANVTHVGRAEKPPFPANTFDIVHSSHSIEHVQWFDAEQTLREWARIVKPGGVLEVWTVNAYAIMRELIALEETGEWSGPGTGWKQNLTGGDPWLWGSGRMLNYPKSGKYGELWMHRSLWSPRVLTKMMEKVGLTELRPLRKDEIRGRDHGWINFGVRGVKC
jgi:ubiquinone/menaquinone biosynthesis C-methylase UbiE